MFNHLFYKEYPFLGLLLSAFYLVFATMLIFRDVGTTSMMAVVFFERLIAFARFYRTNQLGYFFTSMIVSLLRTLLVDHKITFRQFPMILGTTFLWTIFSWSVYKFLVPLYASCRLSDFRWGNRFSTETISAMKDKTQKTLRMQGLFFSLFLLTLNLGLIGIFFWRQTTILAEILGYLELYVVTSWLITSSLGVIYYKVRGKITEPQLKTKTF
jgi:hypothetical protein